MQQTLLRNMIASTSQEITVCRAVQKKTDLWKSSIRRVQSRQSIPLAEEDAALVSRKRVSVDADPFRVFSRWWLP